VGVDDRDPKTTTQSYVDVLERVTDGVQVSFVNRLGERSTHHRDTARDERKSKPRRKSRSSE
jgi:hypothetical protein